MTQTMTDTMTSTVEHPATTPAGAITVGRLREVLSNMRDLQSLVKIGVDKNATVVFPAPLMSTIGELGAFLARETRPPPQ